MLDVLQCGAVFEVWSCVNGIKGVINEIYAQFTFDEELLGFKLIIWCNKVVLFPTKWKGWYVEDIKSIYDIFNYLQCSAVF